MDTKVESINQVALLGSNSDRRQFDRVSYRTVVTAVVVSDGHFEVHRCWLSDISATGARVHSPKCLAGSELYLRILMQGMEGRIIRAAIVNLKATKSDRVGERMAKRFVHGVHFVEFVSEPCLLDKLNAALAPLTGGRVGNVERAGPVGTR
jgi:hypothetical protein